MRTLFQALWVDRVPPPGFERGALYDARDYDFIRARLDDNPIYANDVEYRRTLEALSEHLRRAFLDGDWNVLRYRAAHRPSGRRSARAVVAALDFHRLGLSASQRCLLALRRSGRVQ